MNKLMEDAAGARFENNQMLPLKTADPIIKVSQLDALFTQAIMSIVYYFIEIKLQYLKNVKLFSIRIKELFEPIYFAKLTGI